jgi:hypothetical protein
MRFEKAAMAWESKDACVARFLEDSDISELRAASKDWRAAIDATLIRLRPLSLRCPFITTRYCCGAVLVLLLLAFPQMLSARYF